MIERLDTPKLDLAKTVEVLRRDGVSFDIDGVEVASAILSIREYNLLYGFSRRNPKLLEDVKDYGIMVDWIGEDSDIKDPLGAAVSIWNSKKVLENAQAVDGFKTVLTFLARRDVVPYRTTSRPGNTREWTHSWYLKEYGAGFDLELIRMQDELSTEINPDFKADDIDKQGIGFHFDDSFENAEIITAKAKKVTVILVPQPWNQAYQPTNSRIIKTDGFTNRMKVIRAFLALAEHITLNYDSVAQY